MKNIKYLFLLLLFASCIAKKSTIEYKEKIIIDTVKVEIVKTIIKPIKEIITIEKPCDSLGKLKDFDRQIKTPLASVRVFSKGGNIQTEINIDSLKHVFIKEYKIKNERIFESKKEDELRYKYPTWLIWTAILSILINFILLK
jgi:hypothetical protein